jgi:hypothetical protein
MGVTIHYRGRLDDVGQLPKLCDEMADIARAMEWETTRLEDDWERPADARLRFTSKGAEMDGHLGLKGILLKPNVDAESLSFLFDREGHLRSMMDVVMIADATLKLEDAWVSVKTQFASPEVHAWIVGLLKYVKKRYVSDLQVSDEGQYWETGDIRILRERMEFIGKKIEQLSVQLSSARWGDVSALSADEIALRIEQLLLEDEPGRSEADPPA